jgi:hypothetical protein
LGSKGAPGSNNSNIPAGNTGNQGFPAKPSQDDRPLANQTGLNRVRDPACNYAMRIKPSNQTAISQTVDNVGFGYKRIAKSPAPKSPRRLQKYSNLKASKIDDETMKELDAIIADQESSGKQLDFDNLKTDTNVKPTQDAILSKMMVVKSEDPTGGAPNPTADPVNATVVQNFGEDSLDARKLKEVENKKKIIKQEYRDLLGGGAGPTDGENLGVPANGNSVDNQVIDLEDMTGVNNTTLGSNAHNEGDINNQSINNFRRNVKKKAIVESKSMLVALENSFMNDMNNLSGNAGNLGNLSNLAGNPPTNPIKGAYDGYPKNIFNTKLTEIDPAGGKPREKSTKKYTGQSIFQAGWLGQMHGFGAEPEPAEPEPSDPKISVSEKSNANQVFMVANGKISLGKKSVSQDPGSINEKKSAPKESAGKGLAKAQGSLANSAGKRSKAGGKSKIKKIVDSAIVENKSLLDFFSGAKKVAQKKDEEKCEDKSAKTLIQKQGKKESTLVRKKPDGDVKISRNDLLQQPTTDIEEIGEKISGKRKTKKIKTNQQDEGNLL